MSNVRPHRRYTFKCCRWLQLFEVKDHGSCDDIHRSLHQLLRQAARSAGIGNKQTIVLVCDTIREDLMMDVCSMMKQGRLSHRRGYCHVPRSHSFSVTPGYRAKQTAGRWGVGDVNWIVTHTLQ